MIHSRHIVAESRPDPVLIYEAVSEATAQAEAYARTASDFAAIGDAKGLAYSIRCAALALQTAAEMAEGLRPRQQGRRAT